MNQSTPSLDTLALFVEVARAGSFSAAARRLGLPQSTISRRIGALEAALGLQLLARTTRRVELTEAGQTYFQRAQGIADEAARLHAEMGGLRQRPSGVLRVSMPAEFARAWLAPRLPEFVRRYPDITLHLDASPRRVDLIGEPFDVAIRAGALPDSGLFARVLMRVPRCLYAAPAWLQAHGAPRTPADVPPETCLHLGGETHWLLESDAGQRVRVPLAGRITATDPGLLQALTAQGMGIALLPAMFAASGATAHLRPVLPGWHAAPVPICALTATRLLPARVRCFLDFLREAAQGKESVKE